MDLYHLVYILLFYIIGNMIIYMKNNAKFKTEEWCRKIIQYITGKKFIKVRPNWLKNPSTGRNLELDCYSSDLKIALEYNGSQHYEYHKFHKNKDAFYKQIYRDKVKKQLCIKNGISLIMVPYTIPKYNLFSYILKYVNIIYNYRKF